MKYMNDHPMVIATSRLGCDVLNSLEEVVHFIFTEGITGDVHMADTEGKVFLTTNGIFIDYVWSEEYRKALFEYIGGKQKHVIKYIEKMFENSSKANRIGSYVLENACCEDDEDEEDDEYVETFIEEYVDDNEEERFHNYLD